MISIDRIFQTVKMLGNTDMRGNAKPDEIRLAINYSVNEIIGNYFADLNRILWRENVGRINGGLDNLPDKLRDKILYFSTHSTESKGSEEYFSLPDDCMYIDTIESTGATFEETKSRGEFRVIQNTNATAKYPIYFKSLNRIYVYPNTFEDITIYYLRKHKIANWTFNVINGNEVFNPGAMDFQDIDLHPSEEANIILRTAEKLGINLKEQDLTSFAINKEQQEFQKLNN